MNRQQPSKIFYAAAFAGLLPLLYRTPDGAETYFLRRWSPEYCLFLSVWLSLFCVILCCWWTRQVKRTLFRSLAIVFSFYVSLVSISAFLWARKRMALQNGYGHQVHDAELMLKHRPNFKWKGINTNSQFASEEDRVVEWTLDAEGFRNPNPIPFVIDVAFLGDSFTFAAHEKDEELYTTILTEEFGIKGRNYGISSVGQGTELGALRRYALPKRPKVIVLQIFDNDGADNAWYYFGWSRMPKSQPDRENWVVERRDASIIYPASKIFCGTMALDRLKSSFCRISERSGGYISDLPARKVHWYHKPIPDPYNTPCFLGCTPELAAHLASYRGNALDRIQTSSFIEQTVRQHYIQNFYSKNGWTALVHTIEIQANRCYATRELLGSFLQECNDNSCKVIVVRIPTAWLLYNHRMRAVNGTPESIAEAADINWPGANNFDAIFGSFARSKGATYISLLQAWQNVPDFYYWRYESHLNPKGHRALAELLAPEIKKALQDSSTPPIPRR